MTISWQIYALGSAIFAALTTILMKVGVAGVNSNFATFIRTIVVVVISFLMVALRNEWPQEKINHKVLIFIILSGITTGLSWLCYFHALSIGPASKVAPIDKLSVFFTIILSIFILGESFSVQSMIGATLILAGSLVLAYS